MATLGQFLTSALYVTFCTASIGFGALYFRKVVDDLELKKVLLGEELYLLYDPKAFLGIGIFAFFFCIFVFLLSLKQDLTHEERNMSAPGLILMVVPMVLVVNMIQLYLRARWQRLSVRTGGLLIRRMFSEKMVQIRFSQRPLKVIVERESLWFRLLFADREGNSIGRCSVSAKGLEKMLETIGRVPEWTIQSPTIDLEGTTKNDSVNYD